MKNITDHETRKGIKTILKLTKEKNSRNSYKKLLMEIFY